MSFLESEALCPYFIDDTIEFITCEAGKLLMKDKKMHREMGYGHCADKYEQCPLKLALDHYYERNGISDNENNIGRDAVSQSEDKDKNQIEWDM